MDAASTSNKNLPVTKKIFASFSFYAFWLASFGMGLFLCLRLMNGVDLPVSGIFFMIGLLGSMVLFDKAVITTKTKSFMHRIVKGKYKAKAMLFVLISVIWSVLLTPFFYESISSNIVHKKEGENPEFVRNYSTPTWRKNNTYFEVGDTQGSFSFQFPTQEGEDSLLTSKKTVNVSYSYSQQHMVNDFTPNGRLIYSTEVIEPALLATVQEVDFTQSREEQLAQWQALACEVIKKEGKVYYGETCPLTLSF